MVTHSRSMCHHNSCRTEYNTTCLPIISSNWYVRSIFSQDIPAICSWVHNRRLLQLVSSDDADFLTESILSDWLDHAVDIVIIADILTGEPVGFCTLSSTEVEDSPPGFVEICHLIVNPRFRYLFIGPRICKAAKKLAKRLGFQELFGRVVPQHRFGLLLAKREKFIELSSPPSHLPLGFKWFRYPLTAMTT